jgi:hypothetical protein
MDPYCVVFTRGGVSFLVSPVPLKVSSTMVSSVHSFQALNNSIQHAWQSAAGEVCFIVEWNEEPKYVLRVNEKAGCYKHQIVCSL